MADSKVITKLKKAIEILESDHVREVEVKFRGIFDDVRYYDATTWNGLHKYTVRVQDWFDDEKSEMQRWAKCSCAANALNKICRHVIKVSEVDAELSGRDLWVESFADYGAHKAPARTGARKVCLLCNQPSDTEIHYECHRAEEYAADRQIAA